MDQKDLLTSVPASHGFDYLLVRTADRRGDISVQMMAEEVRGLDVDPPCDSPHASYVNGTRVTRAAAPKQLARTYPLSNCSQLGRVRAGWRVNDYGRSSQ